MLLRVPLIILFLSAFTIAHSQVGVGLTVSNDLYNVYNNPIDVEDIHRRNGSALLSLGLGPKIWLGAKDLSFSLESTANLSPLGLALKDYKGLGAVSFPILAKINFKGLSGFNKLTGIGYSIGGGIQYSRTELFGLDDEFAMRGVQRDFFRTYNVQVAAGLGLTGFSGYAFFRYGFNPDLDGANNFHFGLQFDFNFIELKKIHKPESAL